jgi:acyl-CoA synthetase (AMP-forming)/AMP-acid ligase II
MRWAPLHDLHPELALLLTTSGSTGSPRLVRLSQRNVQSNAEAIAESLRIGPDDVAATTLPMAYCYGLSVLHSHLQQGAAVVLTDRSVVDPCFWDLVRAHRVTTSRACRTPSTCSTAPGSTGCTAAPAYLTQAGGALPLEQVRRWAAVGRDRGWQLVVMYGQTEATARMAYLPPELAHRRPGSVGRPVPGGSVELVPVDGVQERGVGELVYRGPNVMLGYADHPADLALGRTVHELRTGDLARRGPDG